MKTYLVGMRNALACIVLAFVVLFGPGCVKTTTVVQLGFKAPMATSVTFHCDTAYTTEERAELAAAARIWSSQTGGLAVIELVYDVDFDSVTSIKQHTTAGHNINLRMESWMELVSEEDSPDGLLLGITSPSGGIHNPWGKPVTIGFVMDRMETAMMFRQVALHEFGHVLGLPHNPDIHGIMFPSEIAAPSVCLKKSDLVSFCTINECGDAKLLPCE